MNADLGILCLDNEWKITSVSTAAASMIAGDKYASVKLEGSLLSEHIPVSTGGGLPSFKAVEEAFSSAGNISVSDFTSSIDGNLFVFCITRNRGNATGDKEINRLYRQNKKLTAIGIFSGGIAHDYNNALTAVLGNISLAKFEAENNRELMELLNDAEKASMRIKALTERLSSYSRGIKLARTKVDFAGLVTGICAEKNKGYTGSITLTDNDNKVEVEGDPDLLAMTVECVLQNSIEATDPESGKISLDLTIQDVSQEELFREMVLIPGKYIRLNVSDNGAGIAQEKINDIFNPYYTTRDDHDGIGLALAYSILKRHRGFISVNSAPGNGSTFSLYIPLF